MKTINISSLTSVATQYDGVLRTLPFYYMESALRKLRINVMSVNGKHVNFTAKRAAGILRPYVAGITLAEQKELLKFYEAILQPELTYAQVIDNITNYQGKEMLYDQGKPIDLKGKRHPMEYKILDAMLKSYSEDVLSALFKGERDVNGTTPATAFNGIFTKIDLLKVAGEISSGNGNLVNSNSFAAPANSSDTAAYDRLIAWLKSANEFLKQDETLLYITDTVLDYVFLAFKNKVSAFDYPDMDRVLKAIRSDAHIPGLTICTHAALGTGSRLILCKAGLFDLGVNSASDARYIQIRNPYEDPNMVQYWIETAYDTRINCVDKKVFMTNEQSDSGTLPAGDYTPTTKMEYTVTFNSPTGCTVAVTDDGTAITTGAKVESGSTVVCTVTPTADTDTAIIVCNGEAYTSGSNITITKDTTFAIFIV